MELRYKLQKDMEKASRTDRRDGRSSSRRTSAAASTWSTNTAATTPRSSSSRRARPATRPTSPSTRCATAGLKVGNLRMRVFRPFPFDVVRRVLPKAKKIAVVDRNISYGHHGIFAQEVKSALYGRADCPRLRLHRRAGRPRHHPGLLPRDRRLHAVATTRPEEEIVWIGVKK